MHVRLAPWRIEDQSLAFTLPMGIVSHHNSFPISLEEIPDIKRLHIKVSDTSNLKSSTEFYPELASEQHCQIASMPLSVLYATVAGLLVLLVYFGRRAILPKPLRGIPYNQDAASRILGDVPEMMSYVMQTKRVFVSQSKRKDLRLDIPSLCSQSII